MQLPSYQLLVMITISVVGSLLWYQPRTTGFTTTQPVHADNGGHFTDMIGGTDNDGLFTDMIGGTGVAQPALPHPSSSPTVSAPPRANPVPIPPPAARSPSSVQDWVSEITLSGYVFNMRRVCVHRNQLMFLRATFPHPEEKDKTMAWMTIKDYPDGLSEDQAKLLDPSLVTVYNTPTVLIAGASTGRDSNPTHALYNIFGSFSIGMANGNAPHAPYTQVFYHTPGRTETNPAQMWDAAFGQELGLLARNLTVLVQPTRETTACFENLVGARVEQPRSEVLLDKGQWFRRVHEWITKDRPPPPDTCEIIVMDRTDMPQRHWTNSEPFVKRLRALHPTATIHYFHADNPFTALLPREQFDLFSRASIFVGPQGGIEGNFIFMRPKSMLITMCCPLISWSHGHYMVFALEHEWHMWASGQQHYHKGYTPDPREIGSGPNLPQWLHTNNSIKCFKSKDVLWLHSNFEVVSVDKLLKVVSSLSSGPCARDNSRANVSS